MADPVIVYGIHAVEAVLQRSPGKVMELLVSEKRRDQRLQQMLALAATEGVAVVAAERKTLDKLAPGATHQGVMARVRPAQALGENELFERILPAHTRPLLLVLDGVTDPHNLGACLRSADALGACAVIVPRDNSAPLSATARKVACGASEVMPLVAVTNLARCLRRLQEAGVWIVGTAGEADAELTSVDLRGSVAVVMGAEGPGMRRLTREVCDHLVKIPLSGSVSSLNVSVATGILLYEAVRQRMAPTG